jgi:hypothetical protein
MEAADPPQNAGTKLNGIISHNIIILVITTMMTSNLIRFYCGKTAEEDNFMSKITTAVCISEYVQG